MHALSRKLIYPFIAAELFTGCTAVFTTGEFPADRKIPVELKIVFDDELGPTLYGKIEFKNRFNTALCFSEYYFPGSEGASTKLFFLEDETGKEVPYIGIQGYYEPQVSGPYYIVPPGQTFDFEIYFFQDLNENIENRKFIEDYAFLDGSHEYTAQYVGFGYFCEQLNSFKGFYLGSNLSEEIRLASEKIKFNYTYQPSKRQKE